MAKADTYKRNRVLERIRKALDADADPMARQAAVATRLREHRAHVIPARARQPHATLVDLFCQTLAAQHASVRRLDKRSQIPAEVAAILRDTNLPARLRMGDDPLLAGLDWAGQGQLSIDKGRAKGSDQASLVHAFAGVAETGTIVMLSGPDNPTSLNFLPESEIVVVRATDIEGSYEAAWQKLRIATAGAVFPRTVNYISGPSRTADIEQTLIMGAHGPRRLHVIVVDE